MRDKDASLHRVGAWAAVGGVLAAGTVMCATPQKAEAQEATLSTGSGREKPNIVVIMTDNHGLPGGAA